MFLSNALLILAFLVSLTNALNFYKKQYGFREHLLMKENDSNVTSFISDDWFTQKLDHFNKNAETTWKQRFWKTDEYYNSEKEIHFLKISGESPGSSQALESRFSAMCIWGKKVGAYLWNLEHRFYGKSHPTKDMSVENLEYLSGRQALEDLANFIRSKNKELDLKNPKWVVFGGSYAGSLALWLREKHPDLIVGALGSSAPIKLVVDFPEYLKVVEDVYRSQNPICVNSIQDSIKKVETLLKTKEGQKELDKNFNLKPSISEQEHLNDTQMENFFECLSEGLTTQYSSLGQIEAVCRVMNDERKDLTSRLNEAIKLNNPYQPFDISIDFEGDMKKLKDVSFDGKDPSSRAWVWQTCTEYGFFQTTDYKKSIFGQHVPLSIYYETCVEAFGEKYNKEYVDEAIKKATEFYGTVESYNATNVVITHGSLDPWSALGIHKPKNPTMATMLINGTSHCEDLSIDPSAASESLKEVQKIALENIQNWIIEG